jgi:hypothetical protein
MTGTETLQVVDRVGTRLDADKNIGGVFGIVESFAALVESIDERSLFAGQQKPAFAEFLSAIIKCTASIVPEVFRNFTRGGFDDLNLPVRRLGEELQGGVVGCFIEDLIRFEINPAIEIAASCNNPSQSLPVFVGDPKAWSNVSQSSVLIDQ